MSRKAGGHASGGCEALPTRERFEQAAGRRARRAGVVTRAEALEVMRFRAAASIRLLLSENDAPRCIDSGQKPGIAHAGIKPGRITLVERSKAFRMTELNLQELSVIYALQPATLGSPVARQW